ncbi:class I SAM-dependent methyltransferase [Rhabdaerophilum sp. SD176]|uniref:class I SAM-dependent methyltransferase n=1 Tax=Rhabdaerophilum sp. SD176 TaxID=2983548 RepID=UPI0024E02310|nr:class I SAM-dependent methyltransferase [Rhabdaerophilum sp. SD176]
MTNPKGQLFWNRFAERYAARQIKDVAAYEALIADAASLLTPDDTVLELGCGTGGAAIRLAPNVAQFIATDFSAEMIRIARAKPAPGNLEFRVADAEASFSSGPFDAICAFNVLHLVDDPAGLLADIHDHLKPGGLLISKTWCFGDLSRKLRFLFRAMGMVGLFPPAHRLTIADLRAMIGAAGLEIVEQRILGAYPQNPYIIASKPRVNPVL